MTLVRLAVYSPASSTLLGYLPTPEDVSVSFPISDTPALQFTYPKAGVNAALLGSPCDIVTQTATNLASGIVGWTEVPGARFLYLRDNRDAAALDTVQVQGIGWVFLWAKALVGFTNLDSSGQRTITGTLGAILATLFTEAQARGMLAGCSWTFTSTLDSNGTAWTTSYTFSYDPGSDLLSILQSLAGQGLIDYRTTGRNLDVFRASRVSAYSTQVTSGIGTDRSASVVLRAGREVLEAPRDRSLEGRVSTVQVIGDEGAQVTRSNGTTPWGPWEGLVSAGGVADTATLNTLGDQALGDGSDYEVTTTLTVLIAPEQAATLELPFQNYYPGDFVSVLLDDGVVTKYRVRQIALGADAATGQPTGALVLDKLPPDPGGAILGRMNSMTRGPLTVMATDSPVAQVPDGGWVAVSLGANVGNLGSPYRLIAVRKIGSQVYLRGVGAATGAIPAGNTVCTVPAGYAPSAAEILEVHVNGAAGRMDVSSAGAVKFPLNALASGNGFALNASWFAD